MLLVNSALEATGNKGRPIGRAWGSVGGLPIPVLWRRETPIELACLPTALYCEAKDINQKGEGAGEAWFEGDDGEFLPAAIVWRRGAPTS
jgi:hypothetical protein